VEFACVALFGGLIRLLPRRGAMALGAAVGSIACVVFRHDRRVARANLDLVLADSVSPAEKRAMIRATFRRLGRVIMGLFWAPRLTAAHCAALVEGDAFWRTLRELQQRGKGAILVTAHYGDWELLCLATAAAGFPLLMVAEAMTNPGLERIFSYHRTCTGNRTVPPRHAVLKLFRALRRGERVAMMADVNGRRGRGGVWVDFFGRQVFNGTAMAELARRTQSAIVFAAMVPLSGGRFRVECREPIEATPTDDAEADVRELTQRVVDFHAELLRRDPRPWLWTYKRWKRKPADDATGYPFYARCARVK
jgi:KDO2-lipid IV(A) lauroyltransferase